MRVELLSYLCCPQCKSGLKLDTFQSSSNNEVIDGLLKDEEGHVYPIIDGIPKMLPNAVKMNPHWLRRYKHRLKGEDFISQETINKFQDPKTVDSFGFEWNWDNRPRSELDLNRRVLERCKVDRTFFAGKLVLDAGCGAGMQTNFMAKCGAEVIGLDLSEAITAAYKNNIEEKNVHIVQGDLMNPPFYRENFDFVYSEGVLHHTDDPPRAFEALVNLVKEEGQIAAGFYSKRERGITPFLLLRKPLRFVLSKLPKRLTWCICWLSIPLNNIPLLKHILRKTILLYDPNNPGNKATWCINYDFYGPHKNQYYFKPSEVERLWQRPEAGLKILAQGDETFYRGKKGVRNK